MQTNNTTPVSTIFTVITYQVFGGIETVKAFYDKGDAEKCVIAWANNNSYPDAEFISSDEAIDWFVDSDETLETSIRIEESTICGNKTYLDDDMEMLASENKLMAEFIAKLGYTDDQVSDIANSGMLKDGNKDVTTVIGLQNGIVDEAKSFVSNKDAEAHFVKEVKLLEPEISDDDIEACLDNGYWDNGSGSDIFITSNELVENYTIKPSVTGVIEVKSSTLSQDLISIIEGIIDFTPVDPTEFTWLLKMETLTERLDDDGLDDGYEDAFKEEWTKFVKDCESSGAKYVLIDGKNA
ncbi:MAG: hypothetical protein WCW84_07955 [Sulfurimonas sp.]|jgi:hypothetical protein